MKNSSCYQTFCANVRHLRRVNGLTRREMAEILGVTPEKAGKIERGEPCRANTAMLCRLCDRFDLPADIILRERMEEGQNLQF